MGKLEELEGGLYGKDAATFGGRMKRYFRLPPVGRNVRTRWEGTQAAQKVSQRPWYRFIALGVVAAALFAAGAFVFVFLYLGSERREAVVEIRAEEVIGGGEIIQVPVLFRNASSVKLEEAELAVVFPERSLIEEGLGVERIVPSRVIDPIGTLHPGEEVERVYKVRIFGKEGDEVEISAVLSYRPERLKARFSARTDKRLVIGRVALTLTWEMPQTIAAGQETELVLHYGSQAGSAMNDLRLRIDFPAGFELIEAKPAAAFGEDVWEIGRLEPGQGGEIVLRGIFKEGGAERQALRAGIGSFNELTKEWRPWQESSAEAALAQTPFWIEASIDGRREGVIKSGDSLRAVIRYRNRSAVGVKNVSVRVSVEGRMVDPKTFSISDGGVFEFQTQTIVWGPGGTGKLREVGPGEEGELGFTMGRVLTPAIRGADDKNFTLRIRTTAEAPSLPKELEGSVLHPGDSIEFKLSTAVRFSGRAAFRSSPIPNSGPLPPKVGEKTSYAIVWEIRNFTNEVENVEIRASLPPNIRWEGAVSPAEADIRFEPGSGEVRWRAGRLAAGVGVLTPARLAAFQVSLVPSEADIGRSPALTGEARLSGRDAFTGEEVEARMGALTTELHDDPATESKEWRVAQ